MSAPLPAAGHSPAAATVRSPAWIAAVAATLGVVGFVYLPLLRYSFGEWLKPDYSHGFLVPLFSAYLAWLWKAWAPDEFAWPDVRGLGFFLAAAPLYVAARFFNVGTEWLQGVSLVLALLGVVTVYGGVAALRWLYGPVLFLMFMFPLPYKVEHTLGWPLQRTAAVGSEYVLQTIGYPTYREGVLLHCQDHVLEVQNACNGLSMLLTFVTLSTAMALVVKRPWLDRGIILVAAVPIAIGSNILRIALTGVLYNEAGKEFGDRVFHDFAGWMMMPVALGLLWLGLKALDWVFLEDLGKASREDVIKNVTANPALLFMPQFEAGAKKPAPAAPKPTGGNR
ncbi:exosortase/archaeosortase family protein [bacterium]|nr:exosortase/archaeosortase family protein [bacterium]